MGAYVLGVLDDAETERFEEHLAGCEQCGAELDGLMDMPPLLAEFKEATPTRGCSPHGRTPCSWTGSSARSPPPAGRTAPAGSASPPRPPP
ncbi:anti-sigma factor family protein [Streptomyces stramineus]